MHEADAVTDETDDLRPQASVAELGTLGHALTKQRLGDGAVVRAGERAVESAESQLQPPTPVKPSGWRAARGGV